LRQEDLEFKATLGYIMRSCLKRKKGRKRKSKWKECGQPLEVAKGKKKGYPKVPPERNSTLLTLCF
jgi:hypothetical protein